MMQQTQLALSDSTQKTETESGLKLRPYQVEAVTNIKKLDEEGEKRQLVQAATGLGKTNIFAWLANEEFTRERVLILAHRDELVRQPIDRIRDYWPDADIGVIKADRNETGHRITVASVQTLSRSSRLEAAFPSSVNRSALGLIITDEAHHAAAPSYHRVYERFGLMTPHPKGTPLHVGVTATPQRTDKIGLDLVYDVIAFQMGIKKGIAEGYLSDITGYTLEIENEEMAEVRTTAGDYNEGDLGRVLTKGKKAVARTEAIVDCWEEQALKPDGTYRKTIAFCVTVDHAEMVAEAFNARGHKFAIVQGDTPIEERQRYYKELRYGQIEGIANCMVLTEGFDLPALDCVIMARPTKSKTLYTQCVGRGTRLFPGKENLLVLDVADLSKKVNLNMAVTLASALDVKKTGKKTASVASQLRIPGMTGLGRWAREADAGGGKKFDPFEDPFSSELGIDLRWYNTRRGLVLPLPSDRYHYAVHPEEKRLLFLQPRKDFLWDVVEVTQYPQYPPGITSREEALKTGVRPVYGQLEKFVNKFGLSDESAAAMAGSKYAKETCPGIATLRGRDAAWKKREDGATPKQIETLHKMRVAFDPTTLTKAQASDLLNVAFAEKTRIKLERSAQELDIF